MVARILTGIDETSTPLNRWIRDRRGESSPNSQRMARDGERGRERRHPRADGVSKQQKLGRRKCRVRRLTSPPPSLYSRHTVPQPQFGGWRRLESTKSEAVSPSATCFVGCLKRREKRCQGIVLLLMVKYGRTDLSAKSLTSSRNSARCFKC